MATKLALLEGAPISLPNTLTPGRTRKMVQPICQICQHGKAPQDFWKACQHNPYYTESEKIVRRRVLNDPDEQGRQTIKGYEEEVELVLTLNLTQVPLNKRSDSGRGYQLAMAGGYLEVKEFGLADFCEFRECWSQHVSVRSAKFGNYCSEIHAKLAAADMMGIPLDVMDDERRDTQLAGINL